MVKAVCAVFFSQTNKSNMIGLEFDNTATVRQKAALEAMLVSNPDTAAAMRKLISAEVSKARAAVAQAASGALKNDPREAWKAVRRSVYKSILGGQVNILNQKGAASGSNGYRPARKLDSNPHQRGGNRRKRSAETDRIDGYVGKDRGFILRFVNSGAGNPERQTRYGRRGTIAARNWFEGIGQRELEAAAERLAAEIDRELVRIMENKM